jgi:DNA-binding NarL/FixJ family response regulator
LIQADSDRPGALLVRDLSVPRAERLLGLGLTDRQAEVLAVLMEGATNDEIAARLRLSPRTVQKHVQAMFETLGVHTRTAAAARAREQVDASPSSGT